MEKIDMEEIEFSIFIYLINRNENKCISLLEKYPFFLNKPITSYNTSVFHFAIYYGNYTVIDYLIYEKQIDIFQVDNKGQNAMFHTAGMTIDKDNGKMIQKLYDLGISINAINKQGDSVLMNSAKYNMLNHVEFLIELGADVNYESDDGNSLLSISESPMYQINFSFLMKHFNKFNEKNQKRLKKLRLKHLVERGISYE